jgi:DNA invertase Pin-like site-specific DNA recombinase
MSSAKLTPAVAYVRKSTRGTRDGHEKQERSLAAQRAEIAKLARGRFEILKWFEDDGKSGWKRGAARPDFTRMLSEVRHLGATAIVCDNIDRFTRAEYGDVMEDATALRKAGVSEILTASHGNFNLGHRNDIAEIMKFAAAVWAAHEYSRNLGKRIARARRDAAENGKRTGGNAAYGMKNDGSGGLIPGDPEQVKTVRWLYEQFANQGRTLNGLVSELNYVKKIPGPTGKRWYVRTLSELLRRRCYRGDFEFNRKHGGQFFGIDEKGEVVDRATLTGPGKQFLSARRYEAIVDAKTWDKAQKRLALLARDRTARKNTGRALVGILICDHCGTKMYSVKTPWGLLYRCSANHNYGKGSCGYHAAREDQLLPFVLRTLGQEINNVKKLLAAPPDDLCFPAAQRKDRLTKAQAERDKLAADIDLVDDNLMRVTDPRTRKSLDQKATALRDKLDALDAELALESANPAPQKEEFEALAKWWDDFRAKAVSMPVKDYRNDSDPLDTYLDPFSEETAVLVDPALVNQALRSIGAEIRCRWETRQVGRTTRHVLVRGRFRLGQQSGKLPAYVLDNPADRAIPLPGRWPPCARPCSTASPRKMSRPSRPNWSRWPRAATWAPPSCSLPTPSANRNPPLSRITWMWRSGRS